MRASAAATSAPSTSVHGVYVQDWLLKPTDWNWRLDPGQGGALRAVADIGTHWLDLTSFDHAASGSRPSSPTCYTVHTTRRVPTGPVETFAGDQADDRARRPGDGDSEDMAHVLLRYEDGSRGNVTISQVARRPEELPRLRARRRRRLARLVVGAAGGALARPPRPAERALPPRPGQLDPSAAAFTDYPGGHAEGFPDTFKQLYRAVYAAVEEGRMPAEPDFPTFADGHEEILLGEAIARSAAEERWIEVAR